MTWNEEFEENGTFFKSDHENESFIFSLENFQKFYLQEKIRNKAICAFRGYGPTFGSDSDLQIGKNTKEVANTHSKFPLNYFSRIKSETPSRSAVFGTKRSSFKL